MTKRAEKAVFISILVLISLCLMYLYFFVECTNWTAIAAIGTTLAVIWAIYFQAILVWINRPRLNIVGFYESEQPHLRKVPWFQKGKSPDTSYQLSIEITNTGGTTANNAALHVSGMRKRKAGKWEIQTSWIAAPLKWALDIPADIGKELPTEEWNLVSYRPYVCNFGMLLVGKPNLFILRTILMPAGQKKEYDPGEYCFELMLSAEKAKPVKKYIHIQWDGGCTEKYETVREKIRVYMLGRPPK